MRKWSFGGLETIVACRETTQYWTRGDDEGQFVYQMRFFLVIYINLDMYVFKSMSCVMYISYFMFRYCMHHRNVLEQWTSCCVHRTEFTMEFIKYLSIMIQA